MAGIDHGQIKIWGRANSVNVQKVLWCLRELDLVYERIDAGMAFGRNQDPDYLAMNPNGRVPTLVDGDFVLWESNSIMRYLVLAWESGAEPVVVLTKTDLAPDVDEKMIEVEAVAIGVPVYPVCNVTGEGVEAVREHLRRPQTRRAHPPARDRAQSKG